MQQLSCRQVLLQHSKYQQDKLLIKIGLLLLWHTRLSALKILYLAHTSARGGVCLSPENGVDNDFQST